MLFGLIDQKAVLLVWFFLSISSVKPLVGKVVVSSLTGLIKTSFSAGASSCVNFTSLNFDTLDPTESALFGDSDRSHLFH